MEGGRRGRKIVPLRVGAEDTDSRPGGRRAVNQETKKKHTAKGRGGREEGGVGEGKGWGRKRKSPSQAGPVQFWWSVEIKRKVSGPRG